MKAAILATAMAVGFASYAGAAEVTKNTKAPVIAGKVMSDQDMDKITAGEGYGRLTALGLLGPGNGSPNGPNGAGHNNSPGVGVCTTGASGQGSFC